MRAGGLRESRKSKPGRRSPCACLSRAAYRSELSADTRTGTHAVSDRLAHDARSRSPPRRRADNRTDRHADRFTPRHTPLPPRSAVTTDTCPANGADKPWQGRVEPPTYRFSSLRSTVHVCPGSLPCWSARSTTLMKFLDGTELRPQLRPSTVTGLAAFDLFTSNPTGDVLISLSVGFRALPLDGLPQQTPDEAEVGICACGPAT